jgi:hypothetical protein
VGSEMCIRDRHDAVYVHRHRLHGVYVHLARFDAVVAKVLVRGLIQG